VAILESLSPASHILKSLRSPEAIATTYIHYGTVKVGLSTGTDSGGTVINNPALAHKRVGVA